MRTAQEMHDYCLEQDFGNKFVLKHSLKNFKLIENNLQSDEKVLMTFIGLHNYKENNSHDKYYAYALTNKRFIMAQKMLIGKRLKIISLNLINDIRLVGEDLLIIMQIVLEEDNFYVGVGKKQAKNIQEKFRAELLRNS